MVLRRISGPNREETTGGWRRLHNEEHRNLYSSSTTVIGWSNQSWKGRSTYPPWRRQEKHEGKRPLGRPRDDNIKTDIKDMWCEVDSAGSGCGPVED